MNYLFLANDGLEEHPELVVEPFDANTEQNDYEVSPITFIVIRTTCAHHFVPNADLFQFNIRATDHPRLWLHLHLALLFVSITFISLDPIIVPRRHGVRTTDTLGIARFDRRRTCGILLRQSVRRSESSFSSLAPENCHT